MAASTPPGGRDTKADRLARDTHLNVLIAANRFSDGMDQVCRAEGITQAQYVALWVLCLAPDADAGIPMGAVADGLITRASDVTRLIDRLDRAGLAERLPNPEDRRSVLVRPTAAGREVFGRVAPRMRAFHRAQWSGLDRDEVATLNGLLGKALWGDDA